MHLFSSKIFRVALAFTISAAALGRLAGQEHDAKAHRHPQAEALKNPVLSNPDSIAAGQKLFVRHCAECHGDGGKGDGMMGEDLDPRPADLTDGEWKHGSTDGEIFVVIRDGTKEGMKKFGGKLTARQTWNVVNFLRSIGPQPVKSH